MVADAGKLSVDVISPSGETIREIRAVSGIRYEHRFVPENTTVEIYFGVAQELTREQVVVFRFQNPTTGIWKVRTQFDYEVPNFSMWLPIQQFLEKEVVFLDPDPDMTATNPSTTPFVTGVSAYDVRDGALYLQSGRGFTPFGYIKPEVVAPGVELTGTYPGNRYGTMTGTSVAAAFVAGISALFMQEYADDGANSNTVREALIRGAVPRGEPYPNTEWGYGIVECVPEYNRLLTAESERSILREKKKRRVPMKAWEENIRKVVPYVPGEQPQIKDIIKLNTNENPYPPSPGVKKAHEEMEVSRFALYPDPAAKELVTALESYHGLDAGQVFVGVGSDDVLALAFLTFFNSDKPILFPDITYSFYPVWANVYRIPYECPKLTDDFRICPDDYKKENGGVVIANPNAPTSLALSRDEIEEIIATNQDAIVIVDEAYIDYGGESALSLLPKYENLLVVRTYSKSRSMAGMRIGYAMGNKRLIQAMTDVKESINSYTMTRESIVLGGFSC